jgi:hypothetical protein
MRRPKTQSYASSKGEALFSKHFNATRVAVRVLPLLRSPFQERDPHHDVSNRDSLRLSVLPAPAAAAGAITPSQHPTDSEMARSPFAGRDDQLSCGRGRHFGAGTRSG